MTPVTIAASMTASSDPIALAEPSHDGDLHRSEEARGERERGGEAGRVHRA